MSKYLGIIVGIVIAALLLFFGGSFLYKELFTEEGNKVLVELEKLASTNSLNLDRGRVLGASLDFEVYSTVLTSEGSYSLLQLMDGKIANEKYEGTVTGKMPNGELVAYAFSDYWPEFTLANGKNSPASVVERGVSVIRLKDGRYLPIEIISGEIKSGRLVGVVEAKTLDAIYSLYLSVQNHKIAEGYLTNVSSYISPAGRISAFIVLKETELRHPSLTNLENNKSVLAAKSDDPNLGVYSFDNNALFSDPGSGTYHVVGGVTSTGVPVNTQIANQVNQFIANSYSTFSSNLPSLPFSYPLLGAGSISSEMLQDGIVTADKIADATITANKLASGVLSTTTVSDGSITSAKIADGTITSSDIYDNTIGTNKLSGTLTFGGSTLIDLSQVTHSSTSKQGLILPNVSSASPSSPSSGEGYLAYDTADDQVIFYNGSAWGTVGAGTITSVNAGNGLTGGGSSGAVSLAVNTTDISSCTSSSTQKVIWDSTNNRFTCGTDQTTGGSASSLSSITDALTTNTINNGDLAQTWRWSLTTADKVAFKFTESAASTATGAPYILGISTLTGSTANPLLVTAGGTSNGVKVDTTGLLSAIGTGGIQATTLNGATFAAPGAIGSTTAGSGAFTTLSATGDVTMNDAGADNILIGAAADTVTIASNTLSLTDDNWSIGTTGTAAFSTISEGGTALSSKYAPINANFVTVTANGTLTGETGIDALTTAISTTSTLNVDSSSTLNALTLDANANFAMNSGTGTFTQNYSNTTGTSATINHTNSASSGTNTSTGLSIAITGTNNAAGSNTITGINFPNVTAKTNNTYNALTFGTGFNNFFTSGTVNLTAAGALSGLTTLGLSGQLTSTVTTGTAPFVVASTTNVANLNASSLSGATFAAPGSIGSTTPGSGAFTSVSSSGAIAANGGITFDQTSDTIGSFTAGGTILMNSNILQDIGNTGTDFVASTGALTLAGVLTANGGVTIAGGQNLTLSSGTGTFTQTYSNTTGTSATINHTNSASSGTNTSTAFSLTLSGTNNAVGSNTITGLNFPNVTAATNNTFYGLVFGTGLTDILRYNGSQIISGSGVLQSAGLSGTYSNALTLSSTSNTLTGTIGQSTALAGSFTTLSSAGTTNINTTGTANTSVGNGTGTITLTLGSDATGDLFYRGSGGNLVRLADVATGSCLTSGGVGAAPTWGSCGGGGGSWSQLTDPSTDLSLAMAGNHTLFTWGGNTSTTDMFKLTDNAANTGTGYILDIAQVAGSSAKPLKITQGSNTLIDTTSGGVLTLTSAGAATWGTTTGSLTFQVAGTGTSANVQIGAGGGGSTTPDFLVVDQDTTTLPAGTNGAIILDSTGKFNIYEGGAWKVLCNKTDAACGAGSGSALSAITAATGGNTINNGDNAQVWNWQLTTAGKTAFSFGENVASTATGNPYILGISTLNTSTANPLIVTAQGTANGVKVDTTGLLSAIGTGGIKATDLAAGTYANALTLSNASNSITVGTLTATGGTINSTSIGATTASSGKFTTLTSTGATDLANAGASNVTIATTGTGTVAIGNATGTFTLTSNGGLNVSTGGALTGVASIDTITTSATALTFAGAGTVAATGANALTLTGGAASTWSIGSGNALTLTSSSIQVSSAGVLSIPGANATADFTTITAGNALTIQPLILSTNTSTGGALNLRGGDESASTSPTGGSTAIRAGNTTAAGAITGTATGGTLSLNGGNAAGSSGTRNGGNVTINAGTGATANGTISVGTTTSSALSLGNASGTFALTSSGGLNVTTGGALTGVASIDTITTSATAIGFAGTGSITTGAATALAITPGTTGALNLATTNTGAVAIGNATGTFALTSSGGLNVTTGGALTGVASLDTISTSATTLGFAGTGSLTTGAATALNITPGTTGALNLATTNTGNVAIGNATGTFALTSSGGLNVTTGGALTGVASVDTITHSATAIGFAGTGAITTGAATALAITPGTTGALNLATTNTGNVAIGNATGTFALTSSGGLNVTTGGALTGVASIDTITTSATTLTFAGSGTLSSTGASGTLTVSAGATTANTALTLNTTNQAGASTNSGGVTLISGNAAGVTSTAGSLNIDVGSSTTGTPSINIGSTNTNAKSISIGTAAVSTAVTIGNSTGGAIRVGQNGGTLQLDGTNFDLATTGVVTLAGAQTIDITTASAGTSNAITVAPGDSTTNSGTGSALSLRGSNQTGTTSIGGAVNINGGTGTTTNGGVNIGTTNAGAVTFGKSGGTVTLTLGSDATGDLFYRNSSGNVARLADVALGSCLISGGVGAVPTWGACGAGGGISTVRESDGSPSVGSLSTLEFGPATSSSDEFIVTDQTGGVARVVIGTMVGKLNEAETVTGGWTFNTTATTFTTGITANGNITTAAGTALGITTGNNGAGTAGNISLDVGTSTSGNGTISIGTANSGTVTVGRSGQGITLPGFTGNNAVLYGTTSTGVLAATTTSTSGLCLISGPSAGFAPSWTTCPGGGGTWDTIGDPAGDGAINMGQTAQTLDWTKSTTDSALDGLKVTFKNSLATDTSTQRALVIQNADDAGSTGVTEALLALDNADANEVATNAISITNSGGGAFTNYISAPNFTVTNAGAGTFASTLTVNGVTLSLGNGSAATISTPSTNAAITIAPNGSGALNLATTNTGNVVIGNATGTFALTSSGGLNVTTGGALTGVASIDTITTSATAITFAGAGTVAATGANALTLTGGAASTWSIGSGNALTLTSSSIQVSSAGVLSIPGANATADITTITAGNALTLQPLVLGTASGTGGALALKGGNESGTTSVGGAVNINAGTGTSTNGAINIGTTTASALSLGNASGTFALTSSGGLNVTTGGALTGVASIDTITTSATALGFAGTGSLTTGAATALAITPGTTGALNLATTNTGAVAIGNATGTFALTSSGGLNVTTGGALTGVASIDTITTSATTLTFAGSGTLSSTGASGTLTVTAGATTANTALTLNTANQSGASTASGGVTLLSGNAAGATSTAGSVNIDVGSSTTGIPSINIGATNTNAKAINIGTQAVSTAITIGNATGGALRVGQNGGTLQLDGTNFDLATTGVLTLAGGQAADITTLAGTAPTALVFQPGNNTTNSGTGAAFTLRAGNESGTTSTGGSLTLDAGSGTSAGGAVTIGGTNAASLALGRAAATFALTSSGGLNVTTGGALTGVASIDTITTSATAIGFAGTGSITTGAATALAITPGTTGALNLATTNTGAVAIGNATGTFALTSSGGLNVSTAGALTGISGITMSSGNFSQSGTGTFGTGTGAISLNGTVTLAASKALIITGAGGDPALTSGTLWYDTTANKIKIVENGAVKIVCNTTDAGCGAGGSGARLDQITAATTVATIDSLSNAIVWNWSTLSTQTALTLGVTNNQGITTATATGLAFAPTVNTSGAGTHTTNVISLNNVTTTLCTGTCITNGINFGTGYTNEINFADTTPNIQMADASTLTFTEAGGGNTIGALKEYFSGANYGVFEANGFINIDGSFYVDNFSHGQIATTADAVGTGKFGDYYGWVFDEAGTFLTSNTTISTASYGCSINQGRAAMVSNSMGLLEISPDTVSSTAGVRGADCRFNMGNSLGASTAAMLNAANKWIMYWKVRPSAAWTNLKSGRVMYFGANNYSMAWDGTIPYGTSANPAQNGAAIMMFNGDPTNNNPGSVWKGIVKNGTLANETAINCGVAVVTSGFALLRIEARATNDVGFFVDPDVSNGINFTSCGSTSSTNIPTVNMGPAINVGDSLMTAQVGAGAWTAEVDLFAFVQDDPRGTTSPQILTDSAPAQADTPAPPNPINGADLAENYYVDADNYENGSIVVSTGEPGNATIATKAYDRKMIGVISESPGLIIGETAHNALPIAITGRVPVKVNLKGGSIKTGDPVTSSDEVGVGMKADKPGKIIGTAMQDFNPAPDAEQTGRILVNVNPGYYIGDESDTALIEQKAEAVLGASEIATSSGLVATDSAQLAGSDQNIIGLIVDKLITFKNTVSFLGETLFNGPSQFFGRVKFNNIAEFIKRVIYTGDVSFLGHVEFNKDTAGYAEIKRGERFVDVTFDKEYSQEPIVNANIIIPNLTQDQFTKNVEYGICLSTMTIDECKQKLIDNLFTDDLKVVVTGKSAQGFMILLNKPASMDMLFSWTALAVKDAKTSINSQSTPLPSTSPTPAVSGVETSAPTSLPSPTETPTSAPEVSPLPTETPIPEVTPTSSP